MPAVNGSYRTLLQGVSQQEAGVRSDGQCDRQVNFVSDPVKGLSRRAGSSEVFVANESYSKTTKCYEYSRGDAEEYVIFIESGMIAVYGLDGTRHSVVGSPLSYVSSSDSRKDLELTTIGDLTLITNKSVTARMKPELSGGTTHASLTIKGAAWATTFTVKFRQLSNGMEHSIQYRTASGLGMLVDKNGDLISPVDPNLDADRITPLYVVSQLQQLMNAVVGGMVVSSDGDTMYFNTGLVSIQSVHDGSAGRFASYVEDVVASINDLPQSTINGRVVKVSKKGSNGSGDYYLRYSDNILDGGKGSWDEAVAQGEKFKVDATSMPHGLVRLVENGVIYFAVSPLDGSKFTHLGDEYEMPIWKDRAVGDSDSNPAPSVFGSKINAVGVFQGRLYFLLNSAMVMSSGADYWDLFYETALTVTATDPLDFEVSTGRVHELKRATVQDGDLIVFSKSAQFLLSGSEMLSPLTASLSPVSFFDSYDGSNILELGRYSYFPYSAGRFSGVRELTTGDFNNTKDAPSITGHVSSYIEGDIELISASEEEGIVFFSSSVNGVQTGRLYTYELMWSGGEKIQSSWSNWEYPDGFIVEHHWCIYSKLYVVLSNTDSGIRCLVVHDLSGNVSESFGYNVALDKMIKVQANNGYIVIPVAYKGMIVVQGDGCPYKGMIAGKVIDDPKGQARVLKIDQEVVSGEVTVGVPFLSVYEPTKPFVKDAKGIPITTGYLMVSRYLVTYFDSGFFETTINKNDDLSSGDSFSGRVLGSDESRVGEVALFDGSITVPVLRSSEDISFTLFTRDFRPVSLRSIEWEGQFNSNKRRI